MKKKVCSLLALTVLLVGAIVSNVVAQSDEALEPTFSLKGGFYLEPFELSLTTEEQGARIYYTTDGSEPVPRSQGTFEYTDSILIRDRTEDPNVLSMISNISNDRWHGWHEPEGDLFKGTTIRAVAVNEEGSLSDIVTHSYFVDSDGNQRYSVPVISLATDSKGLFDDEIGLYVNENYLNRGREWERPAHIEFFEEDGSLAFSRDGGVRIHGGYTRRYAQKSFRLYARSDYDEQNWFDYNIFPGLEARGSNGVPLETFKRLILRHSGNDSQYTMFRDGLMQGLVSHLQVDTQAFRPSVVFLNGEFWGLYNIRERLDNRYFQTHYNLDRHRVAVLDFGGGSTEAIDVNEGTEEDLEDYRDMIRYLEQNDIRQQSTYDHINTLMDIDNFIDYQVFQIFFANTDWPSNNQVMWRYNTEDGEYNPDARRGLDGRWRWAIKDTDFGFGLAYGGQVDHNTLRFASTDGSGFEANHPWAVFLFKTLLENDDFKKAFINRFADHINTIFVPERVNDMIDQKRENIVDVIAEHNRRWIKIEDWEEEIEIMRDFADKRPSYVHGHIMNKFHNDGVAGETVINLNADNEKGFIRINSIDINEKTPGIKNPNQWDGVYFEGVPVTIEAIPKEGYQFEGWEGIDEEKETITVNPQNGMSITAVFKESTVEQQLMGDINGDNIIDSTDYVLLQRHVLNISELPLEDKFAVADLNLDGKIDSTDCAILKRYLLDVITSLPY
ncbi:CotH kinase family protein [Herbivorax sp. ANBcel31]|uniref:CotH kinase family protein n=1 Tax=Herbivorax sp. ANBcel31 TaxID=3069754 RepID=UPI0027AE157B|nr:CotH kinase family protein [Herbivorax sp. ANBcel31]MDQ2086815.1 CotH kinase family protein [Herbivorax sp. ANBcel31]